MRENRRDTRVSRRRAKARVGLRRLAAVALVFALCLSVGGAVGAPGAASAHSLEEAPPDGAAPAAPEGVKTPEELLAGTPAAISTEAELRSALLATGSARLENDLNLADFAEPFVVGERVQFALDLNGHELILGSGNTVVDPGFNVRGQLTVTDSSQTSASAPGTGKITARGVGNIFLADGTDLASSPELNLFGALLEVGRECARGILAKEGASVTMDGAFIVGPQTAPVVSEDGLSEIQMVLNTMSDGGAVHLTGANTSFNLISGQIEGVSGMNGGAVCVREGATLNMTGAVDESGNPRIPVILDCEAQGEGGAVYLDAASKFDMGGGL